MSGRISKNARSPKKKAEGFQYDPEIQRIQPLNGGKHARILSTKNARSVHCAVGSDEFFAALDELDEGVAERELERLGWTLALAAFQDRTDQGDDDEALPEAA